MSIGASDLSVRITFDADGKPALSHIDGVDQRIAHLGESADQAARRSANLTSSILAIGGGLFALDQLGAALASIARTNIAAQGQALALEEIGGSARTAAEDMAYLAAQADRLGTAQATLAHSYTGLAAATKGTALEGQGTRDVMEATVGAMGRLGRSSAEVERALVAETQMAAKGTVAMEELRGQLSEALPVAMQAMASAMGLTVAALTKLVETGGVDAPTALAALAQGLTDVVGVGADTRIESMGASLARFGNALTQLQLDIGQAGGNSVLSGLVDGATALVAMVPGVAILDAAVMAVGLSLVAGAGRVGAWAAAQVDAAAAAAAHAAATRDAAAAGVTAAQVAVEQAMAERASAAAAKESASAYVALAAATGATISQQRTAALAAVASAEAQLAGAAAAKLAADAELLRLGSIEGVRLQARDAAAFELALAQARAASGETATGVAIAERQLTIERARLAAVDGLATESAATLAAARKGGTVAAVADRTATDALTASRLRLVAAEAAAAVAARGTAAAWTAIGTVAGATRGAMTALMSIGIGYMLQEWISSTDTYRNALAATNTELGRATRAALELAAARERAAPQLKALAADTGLILPSLEALDAAVARGAVVWDAQTGAWKRGVEVAKPLAAGVASLDYAYAQIQTRLGALGKASNDRASAQQAEADLAITAARAAGDEAGALGATVAAKALAVQASQRATEFARAELATSEQALASKIAQATQDAKAGPAAAAASAERIRALTDEVGAKRTAVAAAQAAAGAAQQEADAARLAAATYGDQSEQVRALTGAREEAAAKLRGLNRTMAEGADASVRLTAAQAELDRLSALLVGGYQRQGLTVQTLMERVRDARLTVDQLTQAQANGRAAEAQLTAARRALTEATARAADALRDLVSAKQNEVAINERAISLARAESDLRVRHLRNLADEADALGRTAEAADLRAQADRAQRDGLGTVAAATATAAAAARDYAAALKESAAADGVVTAEEKAAVKAAEDAAAAKAVESAAAREAARHEIDLADAKASATRATEDNTAATHANSAARQAQTGAAVPAAGAWSSGRGAGAGTAAGGINNEWVQRRDTVLLGASAPAERVGTSAVLGGVPQTAAGTVASAVTSSAASSPAPIIINLSVAGQDSLRLAASARGRRVGVVG